MAEINVTQEDVNQYMAKGGYAKLISIWRDKELRKISQETINRRVSNGGDLYNPHYHVWVSTKEVKRIPQEIINQRAANGGSLRDFSPEQIKRIPQDAVNQYAASGGYLLGWFSPEQIKRIPQDTINQFATKGGWLYCFDRKQMTKIPQEIINQRAAKGGNLDGLTEEQRAKIPQDAVNQYALNGGYQLRHYFTKDQLDRIPQEIINQRVANYGGWDPSAYVTYNNPYDYYFNYSEEQEQRIPRELRKYTKEMIDTVILYASGKITKEEMPSSIFANAQTRTAWLKIVKGDFQEKFRKTCEENGIKNDVPQELKDSFDERIKAVEDYCESRKQEYFTHLTTQHASAVNNSKKNIANMEF